MLGGKRGEKAAANQMPNSVFFDDKRMEYLPEDFDDSSSVYSNVELSNDSSDISDPAENMIFSLGKNQGNQRVKIDLKNFSKTKYTPNSFKDYSMDKIEQQLNTQDLKSSCLCLID